MSVPPPSSPSTPRWWVSVLKTVVGILAVAAVLIVSFYSLLVDNVAELYQVTLLRWVPLLMAFGSMLVGGLINRKTPPAYLVALFVPFVVFGAANYLYFPFVLWLLLVGILALLVTRARIAPVYRAGALGAATLMLGGWMLAQPLIFKHDGFGRAPDGTWEGATVLWDFSDTSPGLPHLLVERQSGETFDLAELNGSPHLLSLWATWCGPCIQEMPRLEELKAEFGPDGTAGFADLSLDEDRAAWAAFVDVREPTGPQFIAPDPGAVRRALGVPALPFHAVLEADGTWTAFTTLADAEDRLRAVLAP